MSSNNPNINERVNPDDLLLRRKKRAERKREVLLVQIEEADVDCVECPPIPEMKLIMVANGANTQVSIHNLSRPTEFTVIEANEVGMILVDVGAFERLTFINSGGIASGAVVWETDRGAQVVNNGDLTFDLSTDFGDTTLFDLITLTVNIR